MKTTNQESSYNAYLMGFKALKETKRLRKGFTKLKN